MSRQSHRQFNAAAISVVVRAGMWSEQGRFPGGCLFFGAIRGCRSGGGSEGQGAQAR